MNRLEWRKDIKEALDDISGGSRLPLLFIHSLQDEASVKMHDETFTNSGVVSLIEREYSPVMINALENTETLKKYRVDWTPAFIVLDEDGHELERFVGYLPAKEFEAQLRLSKGLALFHLGRNDEAAAIFDEMIERCPDSDLIPEAEYFLGAATYKVKGDVLKLVDICQTLNDKYPESSWTKRCSVWSHMKVSGPVVGYDQGGSGGSGAY